MLSVAEGRWLQAHPTKQSQQRDIRARSVFCSSSPTENGTNRQVDLLLLLRRSVAAAVRAFTAPYYCSVLATAASFKRATPKLSQSDRVVRSTSPSYISHQVAHADDHGDVRAKPTQGNPTQALERS